MSNKFDDDDPEIAMMRRRSKGPLLAGIGLVGIGVIAGAIFLGIQAEEPRLTIDESVAKKAEIFQQPKADQLEQWRGWAVSEQSPYLRREALRQLAWAKDPAGVQFAIDALQSSQASVVSTAAVALGEYGSPAADKAKPALLAAFPEAGTGAKTDIAWALVKLRESSAFDQILALYKAGNLSLATGLDGTRVFDPNEMVKLISLDELASMAGDGAGDSKNRGGAAVRQLVATVLSRNADPKYTDTLIRLLNDEESFVAHQAAPGLGKIGGEKASEPLLAALDKADTEMRKALLKALKDGVGAVPLVKALRRVKGETPRHVWVYTASLFRTIRELSDPRAGDALLAYIEETKPYHHWETEAALAMAEVGDVRAAPYLAKRLRMDPLKVYSDKNDSEARHKLDDKIRVESARMLADLAFLHPDKAELLREDAEAALVFWIHAKPAPHANGLRALAAMGSTKDLKAMRAWGEAKVALPVEGAKLLPREFSDAQTALRYLGVLKDESSFQLMTSALQRRPEDMDVSMKALYAQNGRSVMGMSLRGLAVGAAHGLSQWGDSKGFEPLLEYIEDPMENDQSRAVACQALAWVANEAQRPIIIEKIKLYSTPDDNDTIRRDCLLKSIAQRPDPALVPELIAMLDASAPPKVTWRIAQAIGFAGVDDVAAEKLFPLLDSEVMQAPAGLALILGASPENAARAVAKFATVDAEVTDQLKHKWYRSLGYWSTEDLESGRVFRYMRNARAIAKVSFEEEDQEWARVMLNKQLNTLQFDNGPHSFTRVVLRARLYEMARSDDAAKRAGAIDALLFMEEQGPLLALREEEGETGKLASSAYHQLLNPKLTSVAIPSDDGEAAPALNP